MEKIYEAYNGKGLEILGVSFALGEADIKETHAFKEKFRLTYPLTIATQELINTYTRKTPFIHFYVLIDREGVVRSVLSTHESHSLSVIERQIAELISSPISQ